MSISRRQILVGAAATAAVAAMPLAVAEEAPIVMAGGSQFLYGTFGPDSIGSDGDTFIDIITDDVWQKAGGAWRLLGKACAQEFT